MQLARFGTRLRPGTVIAFLALFALVASTAVASGLRKNSVTGKSIRKNAVTGSKVKNSSLTGADIKNDSLTGSDIKESTLGAVPRAETLDGIDSSALVGRDTLVTFNVAMNRGDADRVLTTIGPFTLVGKCGTSIAPNFSASATQQTSVASAWGSANGTVDNDWNPNEVETLGSYNSVAPTVRTKLGSWASELFDPASGMVAQGAVYFWAGFPGVNCRYSGSFVVSRP